MNTHTRLPGWSSKEEKLILLTFRLPLLTISLIASSVQVHVKTWRRLNKCTGFLFLWFCPWRGKWSIPTRNCGTCSCAQSLFIDQLILSPWWTEGKLQVDDNSQLQRTQTDGISERNSILSVTVHKSSRINRGSSSIDTSCCALCVKFLDARWLLWKDEKLTNEFGLPI